MDNHRDYVLMAEDNADDVTLTLHSFKKNHFPYDIVVVADGAEALKHLITAGQQGQQDKGKPPVLILLDLNLPKVSGLEVLRRLRTDSLLKDVPVAVLTSSNEERDRTEARRLGANLYLRKPINFNDFDGVTQKIKEFLTK